MGKVRRSVALPAWVALAVLPWGCGKPAVEEVTQPTAYGPHPGGFVIVAIPADVATLNEYQRGADATESTVIDMLFPTLMQEQPDYHLHPPSFAPRLASSWEFAQDNRTLTFSLRRNAFWSDGVPVTAEDVRFTFEIQKDPAVGWEGFEIKDFISSVDVVDPFTVRFHFTRVYPYQLMDANDGHILPAHAWGKVPRNTWGETDFEPQLVTSGPFRLASHTPQQTLILERDPAYWGRPRPYLDRVIFRVIPDVTSQVNQLLAGQVHVVEMVPPRLAERVRSSREVELVEVPSRTWGFVAWNNRHPLFTDRRVRRALTLGIDRKSAVDTVYFGLARLAVGPVLSSMWAFNRNLPVLPYDPEQARALLREAGWEPAGRDGTLAKNGVPFAFDLLFPATNTIRQDLAVIIQSDLAKLGIRVHPVPSEYTSLAARLDAGDYAACISAWEEATKVDLASAWATPSPDQGSNNFVRYSNPEVDRLIAAARTESDATRAKVILDRIQELIVEDQPVTFLYEAPRLVGVSRSILGADINAASVFFNIEEWYWSQ